MAHHAASSPKRIPPPVRDPGSAHKHAQHGRRQATVEATNTFVGNPADFGGGGGGTGSTGTSPFPPGVLLDSTGLHAETAGGATTTMAIDTAGNVTINAGNITGVNITGATIKSGGTFPSVNLTPSGLAAYNSAGVQEVFISATDGSFTASGTSTITGGTFQTAASGVNPRLAFTGTGIVGYNGSGTQTLNVGTDGSVTISGNSTITGGTIQTSTTNPRMVMDSTGIRAFDNTGTLKFQVTNTGQFFNSGGTFTGGTVQTSATNPRVVFDTTGIHSYGPTGQQLFGLGNDGTFQLAVASGAIIASGTGVTIQSGPDTNTGARVVMSQLGITGYSASNVQEFLLDSTTGLVTATGILTAQPGSTVPWQTTGFFIGGGNLLYNSSGEDPTTQQQLLYMSTGSSVTAGTFRLQYSGALSSALNWNATAAQVQTALQGASVLPTGATVTCSGGPLPGTPIIIALGNLGLSPTVISTLAQSLVGGSAVVGAQSVLQFLNNVPSRWWGYANGVLDYISLGTAFHGQNVLRLTNTGLGNPSASQSVGPYGLVPGTNYTLSAYFKSIAAARSAQIQLSFTDINGNVVSNTVANSSWTTTQDWQRVVMTAPVPAVTARQTITVTGSPNTGTFQLIYNGQITAPINFNATAAQVVAALQALSNVGSTGVGYGTGGPLPNTPISVTFLSPAGTPTTMTFVNNLGIPFTGELGIVDSRFGNMEFGVRKGEGLLTPVGMSVSNNKAVNVAVQFSVLGSLAGEVFYLDGCELEVGDAPTAYKPQPDEIVANVIQANMINVAQLSAISANMGSITAGTVTGATFRTAATGARVVLDAGGLNSYSATGTNIFKLNSADGSFTANGGIVTGATIRTSSTPAATGGTVMDGTGYKSYDATGRVVSFIPSTGGLDLIADYTVNSIRWQNDPTSNYDSGNTIALINAGGYTNPNQNYVMHLTVQNPNTSFTNPCTITMNLSPVGDTNNYIQAYVTNAAQTVGHWCTIIDGTGLTTMQGAQVNNSGGALNVYGEICGRWNGWPGGGISMRDFNGHTVYVGWTGSVLQWYVDSIAVNCASSIALKKEIEPIVGAMDVINNLQGVSFKWNEKPFNQEILNHGLIAEEVATALPSAVHHQINPATKESELFLDELPLIAVLVESVKELNTRLERIEQTNNTDALVQLLTHGNAPALQALTAMFEKRHFGLEIDQALGGDTTDERASIEKILLQLGGPIT